MRKEFDIVIVGGGGSGLAVAVSAAEHGAEVLVLEKYPECGGSTGIGGVVHGQPDQFPGR